MDYGVAVATTTQSWKVVKRAEELGFSHAWFYDTQLLNPDVFMGMTMAAMHTDRIRLGTGVLIPSNRIEPVTANALATLNKLAPGRVDFGVGTGFTGRRTMGLKAIPLRRMQTYIERVQRLLLGETVEWDFEGEQRQIGFLNPDYGLINVADPIDLHISAMGPKARRLVAEMNAGWLNFGADEASALADLQDFHCAWQTAGNSQTPYATLFSLGCVLAEGEAIDSDRAVAQAGPYVSVFFHNLVEVTRPGSMELALGEELSQRLERYRRDVYDQYPTSGRYLHNHRGHLIRVRPEERALISADLIEAMTFTGTRSALRDRLRNLQQAGYSQFAIQIVEGQEAALEDWAEVFESL
ncbi:MAG: LLM class flavin-dependent oxidoreductase [Proteobacteria bacterium]|nr:LLM class flavin-dependent oxidoreductase [Pseudomonadota bacterium]